MPRQYKACLFDLDGTLIRSTHHFDDVWIRWAGLHGIDPAWLAERNLVLFLNLEARDPALAATVHDVHQYGPDDIACGQRYTDAVTAIDGRIVADLSLISATQPDTPNQ